MRLPEYEQTKQATGFDPDAYPKKLAGLLTFLMEGKDAGHPGEAADNTSGGGNVSGAHNNGAPVAQGRKTRRCHAGKAPTVPGK